MNAQNSFLNWHVVATGFLPFFIFLIAATAELNRPPFDLVEAEQELVGGFNTEYSSIRFALFFLAEFMNTITMSAVIVTLFFGGPQPLKINIGGLEHRIGPWHPRSRGEAGSGRRGSEDCPLDFAWRGGRPLMELFVFICATAMVLVGAVGVIVRKHPVHAALSLVLTLFGVAVMFVAQDAHFLAAVQVIVYAGAIVVLFLFVIMLLGVDRVEDMQVEPITVQRPLAVIVGGGLIPALPGV